MEKHSILAQILKKFKGDRNFKINQSYWNNIKWKIIKQKTFKENKLLNLESNKALKN